MRPATLLPVLAAAALLAGCAHRQRLEPTFEALAEWACTPPPKLEGETRTVERGGVRFEVPATLTQAGIDAVDPYQWRYQYVRGMQRVTVRLTRQPAWLGSIAGTRCDTEVGGAPTQAVIRTASFAPEAFYLRQKWRSVYPGTDLIVEAYAPTREALDELRTVAWSVQLPRRDRGASR